MNLNSLPHDFLGNDQGHHQHLCDPSQSCVQFRMFFNSAHDHLGSYEHRESLLHPNYISDEHHGYNQSGSSAREIKSDAESGLKLTLWKSEDCVDNDQGIPDRRTEENPKWMSSKMRVMQKMKNTQNHSPSKIITTGESIEDHKFQSSTDHSSSNNSSSYNHSPIRVCSDCNTTKTPLWRSGPNGPKSLCNACGIRQRKARRALAAAAAAAADQPPAMKIKVQHKENIGKIKGQVKKRRKNSSSATTGNHQERSAANSVQKKLRFEDFLINLSKKLSFHRKFPEDEKDAAILLMAISSGLVHG
ncbi:putative GATA transcription factor 22 [Andrographis paniculata]|uniref:putative GATA transcription factor 22 n=1 Tax=Andrographis paniculata TaxID=175694 RepID=UPI0021E745F4|nr:putative GATA transcription factor 22 [Andrographis paniculata]